MPMDIVVRGDLGATPSQGIGRGARRLIAALRTTEKEMNAIVEIMQLAYTDLPTSADAIGKEESVVITGLRKKITKNLVLYKIHHLPQGLECIQFLESTLSRYIDISFDDFKILLPVLRDELVPHIEKAARVGVDHERLATDLRADEIDAERNLNKVKLTLDQKLADVKYWRRAHLVSSSVGTIVAGVCLLAGIWTATSAGSAATAAHRKNLSAEAATWAGTGVAAAKFANLVSSEAAAKERELLILCNRLEQAINVLKELNGKFSGCMRETAFFSEIKGKLNNLPPPGAIGSNSDDRVLRCLHTGMKRDALDLLVPCETFRRCCTNLRVDIQVLRQFETAGARSYVDEWISATRAIQRETEESMLLKWINSVQESPHSD